MVEHSHTFHIRVEKGTHLDDFLIQMKEAFIEVFGEDCREQINQDLMLHLLSEYIAYNGIGATKQYLDELKIQAQEAYKRTLH